VLGLARRKIGETRSLGLTDSTAVDGFSIHFGVLVTGRAIHTSVANRQHRRASVAFFASHGDRGDDSHQQAFERESVRSHVTQSLAGTFDADAIGFSASDRRVSPPEKQPAFNVIGEG
jgi:hypothetical protein